MISYLKGQAVEVIKGLNNRIVLVVEVNGMGYEAQIPSRFARQLSVGTEIQVFAHLQIREEQPILYGFATAAERDLFRQLVSVSGIGAQLAIALIDTLGIETLVQAIVTGNIRTLSKTPGVGQKTAERIALELKTKLSQWRQLAGVRTSGSVAPTAEVLEDVEMTLMALGYENQEIEQAISALSQDALLLKNPSPEEWIRRAIEWLSH
jgi:holliday junction DNA helicase RuvA